MRIAITILGVLVVAVVGGAFALSRLIAAEELRAGILAESEALTGGPLEIEGRVDLSFRPRPTLSFSDARFVTTGAEGGTLEVDRVDLAVGTLALLTGRVEIERVRLVRPRLTIVRTEQTSVGLVEATLAQALAPLQAGLTQLSVVDGSASIRGEGGDVATPLLLERIDLEVSGRSERGPFFIEGTFAHAGETHALEARLGRLTADPDTTLQITLGTIAGSSLDLQLSYRGIIALDAPSDLRGQVQLAGDDLGRAALTLAPAGWRSRFAVGPPLAVPFDLEGVIESEGGRGRLDELRVMVAGRQGEGSLAFDLPAAEIALTLDLATLDLPDGAVGPLAFAPLIQITHGLAGTIDLSIDRLARRGEAARDVRVGLDLDPEGGIVVRQLRAVLPGDTDIAFEGRLRAAPEGALDGRLRAVTDRFGDTLTWLGADIGEDARTEYRAVSLASGLVWTANAIRLDGIDGRLDASRIHGDLEVRIGDRPDIRADLELDRLSLPAPLAELSPEDAFAALADGLRRFDLDLDVEIGRLIHGATRLEGLVLRGHAEGGRFELERLVAAAPAATRIAADGVVDANRQLFEIRSTVRSEEPGPLLRRLGVAPPVSLARLGPLQGEIAVEGWLEDATIQAEARIGELTARARGGLGLTPAHAVEADLDVELVHPRYAQLLGNLGLAGEPEQGAGGPVAGAGKIRLDGTGRGELIGHLALGGTRVTGQVVRADGAPRPSYEIRVSLGEPRFADLLPLTGLAGFRLDGLVTGQPLLGAWPRYPIDLSDLGSLDGRLTLSGKGGVVGEGLEASASSESGRLVVDNALLRLPGGEVEITGELDAGGPVPRLSLTLEVRDLAVGDVLEPLGIEAAVSGRLDLFGRIAGVGDTPYDLVRSLRGDLTFSVESGEVLLPTAGGQGGLAPTPLTLLEGRADIWRGVAELTRFDLDTADGVWRGEGAVDLLLWIAELTLRSEEDDARRIRVVGRPDDPQVRIETLGAVAPGD